jgi:transcription-repair coupling factor (superfamily II helicase)
MTKLSAKLSNVPTSSEALVLARLLAGEIAPLPAPSAILHIAKSDRTLEATATALAFFAPEAEILLFPAWDTMAYDRTSPRHSIMAERMKTLVTLTSTPLGGKIGATQIKPRIILTTASAVLQKLPPSEIMQKLCFSVKRGEKLRQDKLLSYLIEQGYTRIGKAMEAGEFALRGGIIDIIPAGASEGVRVDLFGDEVESIKQFDPMTQISSNSLLEFSLFPISEVLLNEKTIANFRSQYRDLFGAVSKEDLLYEAISSGASYAGMEHFLPLFYERVDSIFDYCENYSSGTLITLGSEVEMAIAERQEAIFDYYEARKVATNINFKKNSFSSENVYNPIPPERFFLLKDVWNGELARRDNLSFTPFNSETKPDTGNISVNFRPVMRFTQGQADNTPFTQLKEQAEKTKEQGGKPILLACFSLGTRERLQTLLMEHGFHSVKVNNWKESKNIKGKAIGLCALPIEQGFETENLRIFSEQDVLGERISRTPKKKKSSDIFLQEATSFAEGDLLVHKEHGIGRFVGLVTLTVSGAAHDCLQLIYAGDDKLFLPVENIEILSRFGSEDEGVQLDKLGGASWQNRKARLKQRIKIAAVALLKIAAERLLKRSPIIATETVSYDDFCARFPYVETEDQARAIEEVLDDLISGKPMDRLICGDVGFGKTEVALRAAFAVTNAVDSYSLSVFGDNNLTNNQQPTTNNQYQVAIVCPTTLLARQHFRNFRERFTGLPVVVRQLSRMVSPKEQKDTKEKLAEGKVDIVIGTHALLAKTIKFKQLGLVIVDEEQHFGVGQKEKLKELKANVHVLTLSATPIPRTLQMALTGVRDLSLITTPPVDRLAVRSFVLPFDPVVIKEAILRELHRGGRCFVVTPRIKDIAELKLKISELVPEAKIAVAHGQLAATDLDEIMNDFYDGKFDILLSTAIIESGLDIPTANTMIIHNAHMFGLAQLYQMRGRVGRGKTRAYAYFLLPHRKELSKNATKRLEVMQTLDTLGAGFTLASHDMDIRGFGNLVGEEQSGHIREVGIELYQQMLEEAVASLRLVNGEENSSIHHPPSTIHEDYSPQINLGISVLIPETYVNDLQLRLGLYKRVAGMDTEDEINSFAAELVDRFGVIPEEVANLITTLNLKILCKKAGVERVDTGDKGAVITFRDNAVKNPEALLHHIHKHPAKLKLRPDQKLVYSHEWKDANEKIILVKKLLMELGGF